MNDNLQQAFGELIAIYTAERCRTKVVTNFDEYLGTYKR
jgi:hypothetical protein